MKQASFCQVLDYVYPFHLRWIWSNSLEGVVKEQQSQQYAAKQAP